MERLIVDTDVLIDATRRHAGALDFIRQCHRHIHISVMAQLELYSGTRSPEEEEGVQELCQLFPRWEIDEEIAILAGRLRNRYGKSHGTGVADCMVAATAQLRQARLVTLNKRHYPMLKDVLVPYKKH